MTFEIEIYFGEVFCLIPIKNFIYNQNFITPIDWPMDINEINM